eukprot:1778722-Rhodomonas_salina.1
MWMIQQSRETDHGQCQKSQKMATWHFADSNSTVTSGRTSPIAKHDQCLLWIWWRPWYIIEQH